MGCMSTVDPCARRALPRHQLPANGNRAAAQAAGCVWRAPPAIPHPHDVATAAPTVIDLDGRAARSMRAVVADLATGVCRAGSSTICARRQVTTDSVPRRTIRSDLRPWPSSICRS
jgi:hypothetical protein